MSFPIGMNPILLKFQYERTKDAHLKIDGEINIPIVFEFSVHKLIAFQKSIRNFCLLWCGSAFVLHTDIPSFKPQQREDILPQVAGNIWEVFICHEKV